MKRNQVSVAMLAALAVCAVAQNASYAQGGVLLPETSTAPVVRVVPNVVEYPAKKVVRTVAPSSEAIPTPRAATPMKATGHIVHVQQVTNSGTVVPVFNPGMVAPMTMGGFVTPRPITSLIPSTAVPGK